MCSPTGVTKVYCPTSINIILPQRNAFVPHPPIDLLHLIIFYFHVDKFRLSSDSMNIVLAPLCVRILFNQYSLTALTHFACPYCFN